MTKNPLTLVEAPIKATLLSPPHSCYKQSSLLLQVSISFFLLSKKLILLSRISSQVTTTKPHPTKFKYVVENIKSYTGMVFILILDLIFIEAYKLQESISLLLEPIGLMGEAKFLNDVVSL